MRRDELSPRNGQTLVVGIVTRISGRPKQKEVSLEDQEDNAKETIKEMFDGPVEFHVISTITPGEILDRPELEQIETHLRARTFDVFVFDDLSRLVRGGEAVRLLGVGVDNGVRSICLCDGIDTNDDTWEEDALNACSENVANNSRTSKRIKQKMMMRFKRRGVVARRLIAGYTAPTDATTYAEWEKIETATPIIERGKDILLATGNCSEVADYFNEISFPLGQYRRNEKWDGKMVRQFYGNTLLAGRPGRGFKRTMKFHGTGRRRSVTNPDGAFLRHEPHLAHLDPEEFDALNAFLKQRNANYGRKPVDGQDPLKDVPRKRTRFPGQHARCYYCGRQFVWGGNGLPASLMCAGARDGHCWNSVSFDGGLAARRLVDVLNTQLQEIDGLDDQFVAMVNAAMASNDELAEAWLDLQKKEAAVTRTQNNVADAIAECGLAPVLKQKLAELNAQQLSLSQERRRLEKLEARKLDIPMSTAQLREQLGEQLQELAIESPACGDQLRLLIPEFFVYLVRSCDGGHLLPRARVKLTMAGSIKDAEWVPGLADLLSREITVDLFDPPQREQIRLDAVRLHSQNYTHKEIARRLEGQLTSTAVGKALALHRQMLDEGLSSPYQPIFEPPADYLKLRRHRNAKFQFELLDGYQPRPL